MTTTDYDEAFILDRIASHQTEFLNAFQHFFSDTRILSEDLAGSAAVPESHELLADLSLRGGKRQRVAFMKEAAALIAGDAPVPGSDSVSLSIELLQSHLLIHDDIIDQSSRRRGGPSTIGAYQLKYPDRPAQALGLALLTGDDALMLAIQTLIDSGLPAPKILRLVRLQTEAALHTFAGQIMDLERDTGPIPTIAQLDSVSDMKAVRSSAYAPIALGLELVDGLDASAETTIRDYAWCFGISGQMCDDYLSLFGDEAVTGKPASADVRDGRRTYVIAETIRRASADQRALIGDILGNTDADETDVARIREMAVGTGAADTVSTSMRAIARRGQAIAGSWRGRWADDAVEFFRAVAIWGVERNL